MGAGVVASGGGAGAGVVASGGGVGDGEEDLQVVDDNEHLVQEALRQVPPWADVEVDFRQLDIDEDSVVEDFMRESCGCKKWDGKPCSGQFHPLYVKVTRLNFSELTTEQLDLVIMGQLIANSSTSDTVVTESRHKATERRKAYTRHFHQGRPICPAMFRFIHRIGTKRLKNIAKSVADHGVVPRVHGNTNRLPKHTLSLNSVEYVVRFLINFTEVHGLLLPGRVPGYSRDDIKLLPSSMSKHDIWKEYFQAAQQDPEVHAVAYTTFCCLWRKLLPSILPMKPMTDLCAACQKTSYAIRRAANCPEREKTSVLKEAEEHLRIVQIERSFYKTTCDDSKREIVAEFTTGDKFQPPPLAAHAPANSRDISVHYSFDYAQQVHYPSDPMQPGPIYFLTARKCAVFGVNCEAIPRQVDFLCDEAGACGKGANTVISQVDYFFKSHGLGEKKVFLHADNCCGENKNNCMLQYLAWRVMTGRHTQITLSFLVVGHTKFAPDWSFGLFKRLYRRTRVGSLQAIAQVVNGNFAQLVVDEDGNTIVPTFDWTNFFATRFKRFVGIKSYHHFRFVASEPGVVYARKHSDTPEVKVNLLRGPWSPDPNEYPTQTIPKGLSAERQWYLFEKIREFCPEDDMNVTCPKPTVPRPNSRAGTPADEDDASSNPQPTGGAGVAGATDDRDGSPPPTKKKRIHTCRTCRREGHDSRNCPDKP